MNAAERNIPPRTRHRPNPDAAEPSPLKTAAPYPAADATFSRTTTKKSRKQAEAQWECPYSHIPNELTERALSIPDDDPCLVDMNEDELFRAMGIPEWRSLLQPTPALNRLPTARCFANRATTSSG
ncbi:MAG: hypothetical protein LBR22_00255 [Desulfovibrio sp.]|nr:hypothetical protein [Desulfovibrio sp.]